MARISSKLERAVRALLVLQAKGTWENTFLANDSRDRTLPNRTILTHSENYERSYREEGECHFAIQHHFKAALQSGDDDNVQRLALDEFVEATEATIFGFDSTGKSLNNLADQITAAGRWLAQSDGTPEGDKIADNNADMLKFRCDWVRKANPYLTRGYATVQTGATNWVEMLHFIAFVSTATVSNT
jgi:hypothetical protein